MVYHDVPGTFPGAEKIPGTSFSMSIQTAKKMWFRLFPKQKQQRIAKTRKG
jgi:hypothetical protein